MKLKQEDHFWQDYYLDKLSELATWNLHNKLVLERESLIVAEMRKDLLSRGLLDGDKEFSEIKVVEMCIQSGAIKSTQIYSEFIRSGLQVHLAYVDPTTGKFVEDVDTVFTFEQYTANAEKMISTGYKDVFFFPPNFSSYGQFNAWFKKVGKERLIDQKEAIAA